MIKFIVLSIILFICTININATRAYTFLRYPNLIRVCFSSNNSSLFLDTLLVNKSFYKDSIDQLNHSHQLLLDSLKKIEIAYFIDFPSSFIQLYKMYGSNGSRYLHYISDIDFFFELRLIDKKNVYKKLVDISIGGYWEADGVSYFQQYLRQKVNEDLITLSAILNHYNKNEIKSFWFFFFDELYPDEKLPLSLLKLKDIDSDLFNCMSEMHKIVVQKAKEE